MHIKESDMVADSCTKYIKRDTWVRHMHYVLNLPGDRTHQTATRSTQSSMQRRHQPRDGTRRINTRSPLIGGSINALY